MNDIKKTIITLRLYWFSMTALVLALYSFFDSTLSLVIIIALSIYFSIMGIFCHRPLHRIETVLKKHGLENEIPL